MKKLIVFLAGPAVAAAAAGAALLCAASAAAAPDVVGMVYEDAVSEIESGGGTALIAVTVGDRKDAMGDCLVTNATDAPFVRDDGGSFAHTGDEVLLTLNCNRGVASAAVPGSSAASPDGRAWQARADEQAAAQEEQPLEEVSTPGA
jgi:hypothetical protein